MKKLSFALLLFYVGLQGTYASSVTHFFHLNDEALDFILSSTDSSEGTSLERIEASLREYFESRGVVFDERGRFSFDGVYINLIETEENRKQVEEICEELWTKFGGRVKPPFILKYFSHAEIRSTYMDSYYEHLSEINLFWQKEKGRAGVQIIVLNTDEFNDENIIFRQNVEMHQTTLAGGPVDPFKIPSGKEGIGPIYSAVTFECRPASLNRVYVGSVRGPRHEMVKLTELIKKSKKVPTDSSEHESTTSQSRATR